MGVSRLAIAGILALSLVSSAWGGDEPILVLETQSGWHGFGVIVDDTIVYLGESYFTIPLAPMEIAALLVASAILFACGAIVMRSLGTSAEHGGRMS